MNNRKQQTKQSLKKKHRIVFFLVLGILVLIASAAGLILRHFFPVKISQDEMMLYVGYSEQLSVEHTIRNVTWSSADPDVASVGEDGSVTALSKGETVVTAKVGKKTFTCDVTVHPSQSAYYLNFEESEADWIASLQLDNGSFSCYDLTGQSSARVNPYFGCYCTLALMAADHSKEREESVRSFLDWYIAHMNTAAEDQGGVDGTIYDYTASLDGKGHVISESTNRTYDSMDSYAALFLIAADCYYDTYGDGDYLASSKDALDRAISVIDHRMRSGENFSSASTSYTFELLMNNCEVYRGLVDAQSLYGKLFPEDSEQASLLARDLGVFEQRFEDTWWDDSTGSYKTILEHDDSDYTSEKLGWSYLYRYAVPQLFPVICGMEECTSSDHMQSVYKQFCDHYPDWTSLNYGVRLLDTSIWSAVCCAASLLGDYASVHSYLESYQQHVTHAYPFYSGDSVWMVLAAENARQHYVCLQE